MFNNKAKQMKTQEIINRFGVKRTLINMSIEEMNSPVKVDYSNFFDCTVADWKESKVDFAPDYKSESGSQYMFTDKGVYRKSDHWYFNTSTCIWPLNGIESEKEVIGFCNYSDFKKYASKKAYKRGDILTSYHQEAIISMISGDMVGSHLLGNIKAK